MKLEIINHLPDELVKDAVALYFFSLQEKLAPVFGPFETAVSFLARYVDKKKCLVALHDGKLIGILGRQDKRSGFLHPPLGEMINTYGRLSGIYRIVMLMLLHHRCKKDELYLDGIAVTGSLRSQGIGKRLISGFEEYAKANGYKKVALEVINTNPKARKLYKSLGYQKTKTRSVWPLSNVFGFSKTYTMEKRLD
jgi:ribosomal protein S18 acetylase RimI-like enzyme